MAPRLKVFSGCGVNRCVTRPDEAGEGAVGADEAAVAVGDEHHLGEGVEGQVLDDVDAAPCQQDQVPRHKAPELRVAQAMDVPGHVVRPDRDHPRAYHDRHPVEDARSPAHVYHDARSRLTGR